MARSRKGLTQNGSEALAVRVPGSTAERVRRLARAAGGVGAWLRRLIELKLHEEATNFGATFKEDIERSEGWRTGWAQANATFRRALRRVLEEDPPPKV